MPDLRITGGTLRGRRIPLPGEARPTSERARQAFFNIIGARIAGSSFLELFAGSGAFSFEAVSRGAARALAIDSDLRKTRAIERLAAHWNAPVRTMTSDAIAALARVKENVDVLYADPPYDYSEHAALICEIDRTLPLADHAVVAVEHRRRTNPFDGALTRLSLSRRAEYGEVWITFFASRSMPHALQETKTEV